MVTSSVCHKNSGVTATLIVRMGVMRQQNGHSVLTILFTTVLTVLEHVSIIPLYVCTINIQGIG